MQMDRCGWIDGGIDRQTDRDRLICSPGFHYPGNI